MIRGILGGVLWGGLFAVTALAVVSQVAAPPTGRPLVPVAADGPVAVAVAELEARPRADDTATVPPEPRPVAELATGEMTPSPDSATPPATAIEPAPPSRIDGAADRNHPSTQPATAMASQDAADVMREAPTPKPEPDSASGAKPGAATLPATAEAADGDIAVTRPALPPQAPLPPSDAPSPGVAPDSAPEVETANVATGNASSAADEPGLMADDLPPASSGAAVVPPLVPATGAPATVSAGVGEVPASVAARTPEPVEIAAVPPSLATEAPTPPAAPGGGAPAKPLPANGAAPHIRASTPGRPGSDAPDLAPPSGGVVPALPLPAPPPAPFVPPVADVAKPVLPAEASPADPLTVPSAPSLALADAAPPDAVPPGPAPKAPDVVASEGRAILTRPARLVPDSGLGRNNEAPRAGRLPRIIGPAAEAPPGAAGPAPELIEAQVRVEGDDDRPAIDRYARAFENPSGKPVFAIVLIDNAEPSLDRRSLAALPFPVTFLLDPSRPESALAASIYREGGQEVAMLATGLPAGATPSDLEVTFAAYGDVLPEAVAIVDPETGGFQGDRALATMVAPIAAGQGRGLLSWDRGLNAAEQVARREGLRSGVIYRRLDGEGEEADTMRRSLDRAAFKAAQDGRVIVAGGTRPETVAALLEWAVEGRATTVALAPLSAALRAD